MDCLAKRKKFKSKHPAWTDPNDEQQDQLEDKRYLAREEDEALANGADTSGVSSDDDGDDDDCEMYANDVRSKKLTLETKELRFKNLAKLNNARSSKGGIRQVQFHPKSRISLVSLKSCQADLFEVDGERNKYLQNIKLPRTKEAFCSFTPDGDKIVISSETYRGTFFTYDMTSSLINSYGLKVGHDYREMTDFVMSGDYMACRKEGGQEIFILSSKTYENVLSLKINEPVKVLQFLGQNELFIAGENTNVYLWDLRLSKLCKHRFQDNGSVHTTSMSLSETSKLFSIGSDSGIVNSYSLDSCLESRFPIPVKTFSNLKTPVDILKYNSTGELLLMGSRAENGAFRMIHSHSATVYKNFPAPGKKFGTLLSADFSPLSAYVALGSSSGRAHLCRIPYYKSY